MLSTLVLLFLAADVPLTYGAGDLTLAAIAKADDATLAKQVVACTKGYKVGSILRKGGEVLWSVSDASTDTLAKITRPERVALVAVLGRQLRGAEVDAFVVGADGGTPVSVFWDDPAQVVIETGAVVKSLVDESVTAEALQRKYGIGELIEKDAKWDGRAYSVLDQALATLNKEELAAVKGLTFRRARASGQHRALYERGDDTNWISVYDTALSYIDRFTGEPSAPKAEGAHPIAHELGHAIADTRFREAGVASKAAADDYKARHGEVDQAVEQFNTRAKELGPKPNKKGQAELAALDAKLSKAKADDEARYQLATRLVAAMHARDKANAGGRPAEKAYGAVLEQQKSPTPYGRTKPSEHFAESFGIFKADPAAMTRVSKKAAAWFEQGEHLKVALQPLQ